MIAGIIPARYASTRFPGKPLANILGKSMVQHVYEQASKSEFLNDVIIATDDERILDHVKDFGGKGIMTGHQHQSGTERCFEALQKLDNKYDCIINIQGDEPFIDPAQIDALAASFNDEKTEIATLIIPVTSHELLFETGEVKVVMNETMEALYFSRMPIPFLKGVEQKDWHLHHHYYRHAGMYAYRKDVLEKISKLSTSSLEKAESLEQLRWLQHGFKIKCVVTEFESYCIDTPGDIEKVLKYKQL